MASKKTQKCSGGNTSPPRTHSEKTPWVKPSEAGKYRRFCFTLFESHWCMPNLPDKQIQYIKMGREICPDTKREHWQSWVWFNNAKTITQCWQFLEKKFGIHPHVEPLRGTPEQNEDYCDKGKDTYSWGTMPAQGQRGDLESMCQLIEDGSITVDQITRLYPRIYHQYGRTLHRVEDLCMRDRHRTEMTEAVWYYGPTAVGKSHIAFQGFKNATHYVWKNDHDWQDGYTGQETVIINDFRGHIPYNELLQLIDKWPFTVNRRGREPMPFTSKYVIITSSLRPEEVYHRRDEEDKIEQLLRRVKVISIKDNPIKRCLAGAASSAPAATEEPAHTGTLHYTCMLDEMD